MEGLKAVCLAILVTYASGLGIQRQFETPVPPDMREDTSIEEQFSTQGPPDARQDGSVEEIEQRWDEPDENGEYLIDDMRLDEVQFKGLFGTEEDMELLRNALPGNRWTDGVLPYKFSSEVTEENKNKVRQAMNDFNEHLSGCLTVREATSSDTNYVKVTGASDSGCWSSVGMRGGEQRLQLRPSGCMSSGTIQHEFIHALGQFHVQSRPDRDQYVTIMWDNIKQGKEHNFKKHTGSLTYSVPYDPKSFMHYSPWGFAIDSSKPTIVSKMSDVPTALLGASDKIRMSDNILLRRMYGCSEEFTTPTTVCKDLKSGCAGWKAKGYCTEKYVGYMYSNCPETCGFCEEATTIPTTSSTTTVAGCAKPNWKGDNWCDDENNNEGCEWDGGDCCGANVRTKYCKKCECLDPACQDKRSSCPYWAKKGYCTKTYVSFMKKNCKKSCKTC